MELRDLPALNALLNATAFVLLLIGYRLIRQGKREAHKKVMLAAFTVSALFLTSYLIYHFQVGSVRFQKEGAIRVFYLAILLSHIILAGFVAVMAPITLFRALRERFPAHAKIARWTFPIWAYVSVTGVIVYWMLYQL
ncbi:MAG TPA: DUF420 domain-containing protein [Bryobacteraceae bacterium]|nr:DUF420 domain-containing protein [Bryobacteraceae bacterium]